MSLIFTPGLQARVQARSTSNPVCFCLQVMPYLKEDKICDKVQRCLDIWVERQVFSEKFVGELSPIIKKNKEEQELIDNFQVGSQQRLAVAVVFLGITC